MSAKKKMKKGFRKTVLDALNYHTRSDDVQLRDDDVKVMVRALSDRDTMEAMLSLVAIRKGKFLTEGLAILYAESELGRTIPSQTPGVIQDTEGRLADILGNPDADVDYVLVQPIRPIQRKAVLPKLDHPNDDVPNDPAPMKA